MSVSDGGVWDPDDMGGYYVTWTRGFTNDHENLTFRFLYHLMDDGRRRWSMISRNADAHFPDFKNWEPA